MENGCGGGGNVKVGNNADFFVCNASIVGNKNRVWGHRNIVTGNGNQVYGNWNCITGNKNSVKGINNRVVGLKNDVLDVLPSCSASSASNSGASSTSSTPSDADVESEGGEVLLVSVCKRVRIRTDASGRRSCENFRVELVERRRIDSPTPASSTSTVTAPDVSGGGGGIRRCYDLSGLDGADSEASGLPCSVCLSRERCVKLSPCRHVPVCIACTRRLFDGATARSVHCPLCRSPVDAVERLFLN